MGRIGSSESSRDVKATSRSMSRSLLIIRHTESSANLKGMLAGRIDPTPLTKKGKASATALTSTINEFDPEITLVSPMMRCRETIAHAGRADFVLDDRLIEMDYGSWSGLRLSDLARRREWRSIQEDPENFTFPRGESFLEAWDRIADLLNDLKNGNHQRILLVSHGDIIRMIISQLIARDLNYFQKILIEPGSHSLIKTESTALATIAYINRIPEVSSGLTKSKKGQLASKSRYTLGGE
jgi:broad specificity phosphatase PhoE